MRQTLWVEKLLLNKVPGYEADNYLHIHIVPDDNAEPLDKKYQFEIYVKSAKIYPEFEFVQRTVAQIPVVAGKVILTILKI
ncbi:MAG: hypothetical protein LBU79_05685 [Planctomycetota bacterium]|jgi:hypothetical protein|nr:hypothetical protein [Planctomycetota bacterium]